MISPPEVREEGWLDGQWVLGFLGSEDSLGLAMRSNEM